MNNQIFNDDLKSFKYIQFNGKMEKICSYKNHQIRLEHEIRIRITVLFTVVFANYLL